MKLSKLLCIVCVIGASLGLNAQDYKIKISSQPEIGDRYLQKGNGSFLETTTVYADGKVIKVDTLKFKADFEGVLTVLKIDELKRASELKLVVTECFASYDSDKEKIEILQKDSEIIIKKQNKETIFLFHEKPLPKKITQALALFISLPFSKTTDDDVFAPAERKKVGDKWKINSEKAVMDLKELGLKVNTKDITGEVTLEKVLTVGKTKCLFLKAKIITVGVSPPMPPGLETKKSSMTATFTGEFPVNPDADIYDTLTFNKKISRELDAEGKPAPDKPLIKISLKMNQSITETIKNLK